MKQILKWVLQVNDEPQEIGGGPVVHIESQFRRDNEIMVWTCEELNPEDRRPKQVVKVHGTGHPFNDSGYPLGSVVAAGGRLVWHVVRYQ